MVEKHYLTEHAVQFRAQSMIRTSLQWYNYSYDDNYLGRKCEYSTIVPLPASLVCWYKYLIIIIVVQESERKRQ